jgi:hypothetical protein
VRKVSVQESGTPVSVCSRGPANKDNRSLPSRAANHRSDAAYCRGYSASEHSRLNSFPHSEFIPPVSRAAGIACDRRPARRIERRSSRDRPYARPLARPACARGTASFALMLGDCGGIHQHAGRPGDLRTGRRAPNRSCLSIRQRVALTLSWDHETARRSRDVGFNCTHDASSRLRSAPPCRRVRLRTGDSVYAIPSASFAETR